MLVKPLISCKLVILICGFAGMLDAAPQQTDELHANWSIYGNGYQNHRHSPLTQINTDNIDELTLAWRYRTGKKGTFQTSPIVIDDIMYFSTAFNDVVALNAASGQEIWRYYHKLTHTKTCCGPANRGVAVSEGKVFQATIDGRLLALDQSSGDVIWDVTIKDIRLNIQENLQNASATTANQVLSQTFENAEKVGGTGHSFNMAPQVFNGLIFVGSTGAGYGLHLDTEKGLTVVGKGDGRTGLRGFIAAFDVNTGEEVWRWYSVADSGWTGDWVTKTAGGEPLNRDIALEQAQSQRFANSWKLGGGSIWTTPAIDTETGIMYLGTGNPAPNMEASTRPGDNLNTSSIVALDTRTGELLWAFQQVPYDRWGYDVASPILLFEVKHQGKTLKALGQAGKTGWFYVLDRASGKLLFKSEPFVPQHNLFANPTEKGVTIYPAIDGGSNWSPVAMDPSDNTVFIAGVHLPATYYKKPLADSQNQPWKSYTYFEFDYSDKYGLLSAIDLNTGKRRWQHKTENPLIGGVLHTAGGLTFSGEGKGELFALDAKTGARLWSHTTQYGVNAPPISYQSNGQQYIAVAAGGNKLQGFKVGDEVLAFSLNKKGD